VVVVLVVDKDDIVNGEVSVTSSSTSTIDLLC
jgi:hypothetical protein